MQKCKKCNLIKRLNEFTKNNASKTGLRAACRRCTREYSREYYKTHKERARLLAKKRRLLNKGKPSYKLQRSNYFFKRTYGLTLEQVKQIFRQQKGKCSICKKRMRMRGNGGKRAHIDHDHKNGKIRGMICDICNRGLGFFQDNTKILKSAIRYLRKSQAP